MKINPINNNTSFGKLYNGNEIRLMNSYKNICTTPERYSILADTFSKIDDFSGDKKLFLSSSKAMKDEDANTQTSFIIYDEKGEEVAESATFVPCLTPNVVLKKIMDGLYRRFAKSCDIQWDYMNLIDKYEDKTGEANRINPCHVVPFDPPEGV